MTDIGGGSLLIAWQLKDKKVLIVGGGVVASQRIESLLVTDALITIIAPAEGLQVRTKELISEHSSRVVHFDRRFSGADELDGVDMALTALDDNKLSEEIVHLCRERRIPVNAADIPPLCDFYFGAQIRDGPLQIMISTNGSGPRIAALIRTKLQEGLTGQEGRAIEKVGALRDKLKERVPGVGGKEGKQRMKWMKELCDIWRIEDLASLDENHMDLLLDHGWSKGRTVPSPQNVLGKSLDSTNFDIWSILQRARQSNTTAFILGVVVSGLFFASRRGRV